MTDNTNRLTAILIAAVALIGLGCAVAVANTSNSGTNTADTTADDYSTYTYYGTTSSDVAAEKMSAEEITMLTSDLMDARLMCESATMALGQISFTVPVKEAGRCLEAKAANEVLLDLVEQFDEGECVVVTNAEDNNKAPAMEAPAAEENDKLTEEASGANYLLKAAQR